MNQFFKDLGLSAHSRWQSENFSLASFPEIARQALSEKPPCEHVDLAASQCGPLGGLLDVLPGGVVVRRSWLNP